MRNNKAFINIIKNWYLNKNMTLNEIGERFNLSGKVIGNILKKNNINLDGNRRNKENIKLGFWLVHRKYYTPKEAAKIANCNVNSIIKYAKEHGIYYPTNFFKKKKQNRVIYNYWLFHFRNYKQRNKFIIQSYHNNLTIPIGDRVIKLNDKKVSIDKMIKKYNIPVPYNEIYDFLVSNNCKINSCFSLSKTKQKISVFRQIDTEEKAYWLGFLMADGCVRYIEKEETTLSISLKKEDKNHLEKLKKFLQSDCKIRDYTYNGYPIVSMTVCGSTLIKDLINHGVVPNKTYIADFPLDIPFNLINHFIRGVFDGDGSIPLNKKGDPQGISILGTKNLCEKIVEYMKVDKKYLYKNERCKNLYEIRCNKRKLALNYLEFIYNNSTIYLNRKYKRFIKMKEKINKM